MQNVGDHFLGSQTRGVDDLRIRCGPQRRHRAVRVARVPLRYVPGKVGQANINPLFFQLLMTPHRACFGAGRQNHLQERIREHDGPDVAPIRDEARRHARNPAAAAARPSRTSGTAATFEAASPGAFRTQLGVDIGAFESHTLAPRAANARPCGAATSARARRIGEIDTALRGRERDEPIQRAAVE